MAPIWREASPGAIPVSPVHVGGVRVRPISRSFVRPASPTPDHWLPLSNLDRVVNPTFSSIILFYDNIVDTHQSFQDVTKSLKESLSKALVYFFPLAGRLALKEDGLVDLQCNDEGAVFLEASVDANLSSIGGAMPMPALSGLDVARLGPGPRYIPDQLKPMPTLVIMCTEFMCGSIAIAVNWHHTVADGSSGCHFMKSWAEVTSGRSLSLLPNHDRLLLRAREPPNLSLIGGYSTRNIEAELEVLNAGLSSGCRQSNNNGARISTEPAMLNSFHITKDSIQKIKEVSLGSEQGVQFTSAEGVSAYLWWEMTKARADKTPKDNDESSNMKRDSGTRSRFFLFVDGRKRMNLPVGYFGNVVCTACTTAREDEILSKPLSYAAALIRKATMRISEEYFRCLVDWVEIQGYDLSSKSEHNSVGHDVAATFWTFFPLYEMDFGWGKPYLAARNSPPRPLIDGIAVMPSSQGPGNMVALLNLHADRMERLKKQDSFKSVFAS